jgi:copper transport protein
MTRLRRTLACALLALGILAAGAAPAFAHATLLGSTPAANGRGVSESAKQVVLSFSEPVQILNRPDVTVVNGRGFRIDTGAAHTAPGDPRRVIIPIRGPLLPQSYTVRYRVVSADSHSSVQAFVFAVGKAKPASPILAGSGGLSDESPAAVAARVAEYSALILLLGLLAFRVLVWGPAVEAARLGSDERERERARRRGQRVFWRAFWALTALAGVAEAGVLAAKSAVVFHTGLISAALHPASAYRLVSASRFGDMLGWRCGALCVLAAAAFVVWTLESAGPSSSGRRGAMAVLGLLGVSALTLLAAQGHASQAPLAPLEIAFDATHLTAVSIWMGGLVCLVAVLLGAPRAFPDGGRSLSSETLTRFSRVALWSVVAIATTGLARAIGELSSPAQLFTTGYGRSLMLKASLLAPILVLARRNRRVVAAFAGGLMPTPARLRAIARTVQAELAIAMGIVVVAAILVAQVPGRA